MKLCPQTMRHIGRPFVHLDPRLFCWLKSKSNICMARRLQGQDDKCPAFQLGSKDLAVPPILGQRHLGSGCTATGSMLSSVHLRTWGPFKFQRPLQGCEITANFCEGTSEVIKSRCPTLVSQVDVVPQPRPGWTPNRRRSQHTSRASVAASVVPGPRTATVCDQKAPDLLDTYSIRLDLSLRSKPKDPFRKDLEDPWHGGSAHKPSFSFFPNAQHKGSRLEVENLGVRT